MLCEEVAWPDANPGVGRCERESGMRHLTVVGIGIVAAFWIDATASAELSESELRKKAEKEAEAVVTDMIQLLTECRPVGLVVHVDDDDMIGITKEEVGVSARSRLRGARIYATGREDDPVGGVLRINVRSARTTFVQRIWFEKKQVDSASFISSWRPTGWHWLEFGIHNNDETYVLSLLAIGLDRFIDDYFRANDLYCKRRSNGEVSASHEPRRQLKSGPPVDEETQRQLDLEFCQTYGGEYCDSLSCKRYGGEYCGE